MYRALTSLLGQRKYAEAEPLLLKGYDCMKAREQTPGADAARLALKVRIAEALDRLIVFYDLSACIITAAPESTMSAILEKYGLADLPEEERLTLADALYESTQSESIDFELTPEFQALLDVRLARLEADPDGGSTWDEVMERARARCRK